MMGTPQFWQQLSKYVPFWLGVFATGALLAISQGLLDTHVELRRWLAWMLGLLAAYGITGVAAFVPPREPWSYERKVQESRARLARGDAPLAGFEFLASVATPPPLPPPPPPTTKEGA
jgi:hypothetical protein